MSACELKLNEIIWQLIAAIPHGKVATYGQIAKLAGYPGHARYVGYTLRKLPKDTKLPWHRVVNAQGKISFPFASDAYVTQRDLLIKEGIEFTNCKLSLNLYQFHQQHEI